VREGRGEQGERMEGPDDPGGLDAGVGEVRLAQLLG